MICKADLIFILWKRKNFLPARAWIKEVMMFGFWGKALLCFQISICSSHAEKESVADVVTSLWVQFWTPNWAEINDDASHVNCISKHTNFFPFKTSLGTTSHYQLMAWKIPLKAQRIVNAKMCLKPASIYIYFLPPETFKYLLKNQTGLRHRPESWVIASRIDQSECG